MISEKKWILGQKTAFVARNSAFFYATPMKPHFFWLSRTRLIWIISPPYPEVTLDTFGFPVGGRLAARRAVFRHRLPKVALFGPKNAVFWPEINFWWTSSNFFVTIMTRYQTYNGFVLLMLLSKLQGACKSPFLAQKWPENQIFMLSIVLHGIVWYCMEFLCILWYPIVFMSFHCIVWYCMVLYYILRYCMVLHCWLRRAGCISQDTYLLYVQNRFVKYCKINSWVTLHF